MTRKDITIPLVFSKSFGPEERVGCFSFGFQCYVFEHLPTNGTLPPRTNLKHPRKMLDPMRNFPGEGEFTQIQKTPVCGNVKQNKQLNVKTGARE